MKKYIVSATSNANLALTDFDFDACGTLAEAEETAQRFTESMRMSYFVFEVDLRLIASTRAITTVKTVHHDSAK